MTVKNQRIVYRDENTFGTSFAAVIDIEYEILIPSIFDPNVALYQKGKFDPFGHNHIALIKGELLSSPDKNSQNRVEFISKENYFEDLIRIRLAHATPLDETVDLHETDAVFAFDFFRSGIYPMDYFRLLVPFQRDK